MSDDKIIDGRTIIAARVMRMNDYQADALRTAVFPVRHGLVYPALKLAGEAGEVAEKVGKAIRDKGWEPGQPLPAPVAEGLAKELGDVLWYVAVLASGLGYTLEEIAQMNLNKLAERARNVTLKGEGDDR